MSIATIKDAVRDVQPDGECPTDDQLRQLAAGDLPELDQSRLTAHLDGCLPCRERISRLVGEVPSENVLIPIASDAALLRLIEQLKSESPTTPFDGGSTDGDSPAPLDFLSAADDPAYLGRLGRYVVQAEIGRGA